MARPKVPLISKEGAVEAALKIIDADGLAALNIRALGAELGVTSASLYHHFDSKEAVERAVASWVLDTTRLPSPDLGWRAALREAVHAYRRGLMRHPNALPLLLKFERDGDRTAAYTESILSATREDGLPDAVVAATVGSLMDLVVGSAVRAQGATAAATRGKWAEILDDADAAFAAAVDVLIENLVVPVAVPGARRRGSRAQPATRSGRAG